MTRGLAEALGIPSLDDIMDETEITEIVPDNPLVQSDMANSIDHAKSSDQIYEETMKIAKDLAELGFDLDPARSPRMFEVAAQYFKIALDAKNSKRDQQLKLMKLLMDDKKMKHELGERAIDNADIVMVEDRNVLLKRLREEADKK